MLFTMLFIISGIMYTFDCVPRAQGTEQAHTRAECPYHEISATNNYSCLRNVSNIRESLITNRISLLPNGAFVSHS